MILKRKKKKNQKFNPPPFLFFRSFYQKKLEGKVKVFKGTINEMPQDLIESKGRYKGLDDFIEQLPTNYNFEIKKTIWNIVKNGSKMVALQFPEGLLAYSCVISDLLEFYTHVETIILGDVKKKKKK